MMKAVQKKFSDYFFTTRVNNNIYKFINTLCIEYEKKNYKKNILLKEFAIINKVDIKFLLYIIKLIIFGNFFFKNTIAEIKYKNILVGNYLLSSTLRHPQSYNSRFIFYYELLKNVYRSSKLFYSAEYYFKNFKINSIYIEHCCYLNGIIYDFFYNKKIKIYSNHYPHNIFLINPQKKYFSYSEYLKIPYNKKNITKKPSIIKKIDKVFSDSSKFIPYMDETKYLNIDNNLKQKLKNFDYVVYPHSFTDAQLIYGYDGFVNSFEWLDFTLHELSKKNKKVLIKSHPNFYLKSHDIFRWDRKIFKTIIKKYSQKKSFLFIQKPIKNYDFKNLIKKNSIIITRYGTAELEMSFYNFKTISSWNSFFSNRYKISNKWKNREQYKILLDKNWRDLKFSKKNDTINLCNELYFNQMYFKKNFYLNILKSEMIKERMINKNENYNEMMIKFNNITNPNILNKKLFLNIDEFNK